VLFETDPAKAAQLIATNPDYVSRVGYYWGNPPGVAYYCPVEFRKYFDICVVRFPETLMWKDDPIAFLGQRSSPAGHRRLIAIQGFGTYEIRRETAPSGSAGAEELLIDLMRYNYIILSLPGALGGDVPRELNPDRGLPNGMLARLQLSPGVADPLNASHISIGFTTQSVTDVPNRKTVLPSSRPSDLMMGWPQRSTLDVYLRDDDTLDAKLRKPAHP